MPFKMVQRATPKQYFSQNKSTQMINSMLSNCNKGIPEKQQVKVEFTSHKVIIKNAYQVKSTIKRLEICAIIAQTENFTNRSAENLAAEWKLHNIGYRIPFLRSHSIDADLEYEGDDRKGIRIITAIFDILGEE